MPLANHLLRRAYAGIRCAGVLDVKRLLWLAPESLRPARAADGYQIRRLDHKELGERIEAGACPSGIGDAERLSDARNQLWTAYHESELVAYVWFASGWIEASENFSRARHLGTRVDLPSGVAFAYNAWTAPEHRGRRLMPALLEHVVAPGQCGESGLVTTTDWTNDPALAAFTRTGFVQLGLIYRAGRNGCQGTSAPRSADALGIRIQRGLMTKPLGLWAD